MKVKTQRKCKHCGKMNTYAFETISIDSVVALHILKGVRSALSDLIKDYKEQRATERQ